MLSLRPHRRAAPLVCLLWTLFASVQVVDGCGEVGSGASLEPSAASLASAAVDDCACLCACGCPGAAVALLPAVSPSEQAIVDGARHVALDVGRADRDRAAPPTEPPRG